MGGGGRYQPMQQEWNHSKAPSETLTFISVFFVFTYKGTDEPTTSIGSGSSPITIRTTTTILKEASDGNGPTTWSAIRRRSTETERATRLQDQ